MCTYCGCRSVDAIAHLTREHIAAVNLIGEITRAVHEGDERLAAAALETLRLVLRPHVAVEEASLFPYLIDDFPEGVRTLRADHADIDRVLGRGPIDGEWGPVLQALERLREHIAREENGVFPAALFALGPDHWDAMDVVRREVGSAVIVDEGAEGLAAL